MQGGLTEARYFSTFIYHEKLHDWACGPSEAGKTRKEGGHQYFIRHSISAETELNSYTNLFMEMLVV